MKKKNYVYNLSVNVIAATWLCFCFQVVREDKKKVISFASELKKLTSRSRSMATGSGGGVDGPAQSKDDRAACCVALTELQEWGSRSACCLCMERQQRYCMLSLTSNSTNVEYVTWIWGFLFKRKLCMKLTSLILEKNDGQSHFFGVWRVVMQWDDIV